MRFLRIAASVAAVLFPGVQTGRAQELDAPPPAHLAAVDGAATLTRENLTEQVAPGLPLVPGDALRTDRGRAHVLFPDGSTLDLDEHSALDFLSPTVFRLTRGRLLLLAAGVDDPASASRFAIHTPSASVDSHGPGEYRVAVQSDPSGQRTELAVLRGSASLATDFGTAHVRTAERSIATGDARPSEPRPFNSARLDDFERWAASLHNDRLSTEPARPLPAELRAYGPTLDRAGTWQQDASYGSVWYPAVSEDWQPYDSGYWSSVPGYGWTWIGVEAWSWPTHHYGRWGHVRNRWFWIPDRLWAPAWVSWGAAPGYVSWCPLGYDNRPVFSLTLSGGRSPRGWVVVAQDRFGSARSSDRRIIGHDRLAGRPLPPRVRFAERPSPPVAAPHSRTLRAQRRDVPGRDPIGRSAPDRLATRRQGPPPTERPVALPPTAARRRPDSLRIPAGGADRPERRPSPSAQGQERRARDPQQPMEGARSRAVERVPRSADSPVYSNRPAPAAPTTRLAQRPSRTVRPPEPTVMTPERPLRGDRPAIDTMDRRARMGSPPATEQVAPPPSRTARPRRDPNVSAAPRRSRPDAGPAPAPPSARRRASPAETEADGGPRSSRRSR